MADRRATAKGNQPTGKDETMNASDPNPCGCPGADEILADLDADLLNLQPGERLWKLFCFRSPSHATGLRHRIYTVRKADGRLALVTFAVHNPLNAHDGHNGHSTPRLVRSGIARVPDLSVGDLDHIIGAVQRQAQTTADICEEVDLTAFGTLQEQVAWLEAQ